jgi:diaminopimelate dehydrogenase
MTRRRRIAVIGFGQLGSRCVESLRGATDFELAGVVRRRESPARLPPPWQEVAVARHVSELANVEAALVCVPTPLVLGVAEEILQRRIPIVECARLEGHALGAHHRALDTYARNHRAGAIVGAGWDPGAMPLLQRLFTVLIPEGQTAVSNRPGVNLHHTAVAEAIAGVKGALATEYRGADGRPMHYLYVEADPHADIEVIRERIAAEPEFLGGALTVLPVESIAALEEAGQGTVLERRGAARAGPHPSLLLEARYEVHAFAARVMVNALYQLGANQAGASPYAFSL